MSALSVSRKTKTKINSPHICVVEFGLCSSLLAAQISDSVRGDGMYYNESGDSAAADGNLGECELTSPHHCSHTYSKPTVDCFSSTQNHMTTACHHIVRCVPPSSSYSTLNFHTHRLRKIHICKRYTVYFNWLFYLKKKVLIKFSFGSSIVRLSPCINTIVQTSCMCILMGHATTCQ